MHETVPTFENESGAEGGRIIRKGQRYFASLDKDSGVPIAPEIAENIAIALRIQAKVDKALESGLRPGFLRTIQLLNCRKTAFAVTESQPVRELTVRTKQTEDGTRALSGYELSAIPELLQDMERITGLGKVPVLGNGTDLEIERYLKQHHTVLPAIVHVFEIKKEFQNEIITALLKSPASLSDKNFLKCLRLNHTFLAFDKDKFERRVCFHKRGPSVYQDFELTDLDSITHFTIGPKQDHMYLSFIGPAPWRRPQKAVMKQTR